MKRYIGVDLGGTNISCGVVDEGGNILLRRSVKTNAVRGTDAIVRDIADVTNVLLTQMSLTAADIECGGVGIPGIADDRTGVAVSAVNIGFSHVPLRAALMDMTGVHFHLDNDANCAVWAETLVGAARGYRDVLLLTLGTGIGGGAVIGGELYAGHNGAAFEAGHMVICLDGIPCSCGRKGCFEKYAGARALKEQAQAAMRKHRDTMLWTLCGGDIERMNAKYPFEAYYAGDAVARELIATYIRYLGVGVVNYVNILQPQIILFGGGISGEGEKLTDLLWDEIKDVYTLTEVGDRTPKLGIASLKNDAGIIGAALLTKKLC